MAVEAVADSGQQPAGAGNTGRTDYLSEAISAAVKATESKHEVDPDVAALTVDEKPKTESVKETAGDKRDGEDAAEAKAPDAEAAKDKDAAKPEKAEEAPKFDAPKHWPEADRQAFAGLAPEAQAIIKRLAKDLEGGFTRKSQELSDRAKYADAVRGLIDEPTRQQMAATGVSEVQYFGYLNQLQQFASQRPVEYVKWAMQNLGVTPEHLGIHAPRQQPGEQPDGAAALADLLSDPKVKQLEAELAQFKGAVSPERVQQMVRATLAEHQNAQQRQSLQGAMGAFRSAVDDDGQLLHPHFDQVQIQMGALIDPTPYLVLDQQGRPVGIRNDAPDIVKMPDGPEKMKAAYDMAVWARPDLRQSLVEQEASRRMAAAEKAREAARAKTVTAVKPASGVATTSTKPLSLDEIISQNMSKLGR